MAAVRRFDGPSRRFWVLAGVVACAGLILTWPLATFPPHSLDISWKVGLHQAAQSGIAFGTDLVYSYGPLGFLGQPVPFVGPTSSLAFAAVAISRLALAVVLFNAVRRAVPIWLAIVLVLVSLRAIGFATVSSEASLFESLQFILFAVAVEILRWDRIQRPLLVAAVAGFIAAVAMLGKVNVGVFVPVGGAILVLAVAPRRLPAIATFAGSLLACGSILWLAMGQGLGSMLPYARGSLEIISGYSEAMGVGRQDGLVLVGAMVVGGALLLWAASRTSRGWPISRRIGLIAITSLLFFALWKHGIVRGQLGITLSILAFALMVLVPPSLGRPAQWAMLGCAVILLIGAVLVVQSPPTRFADVPRSVREFIGQARTSLFPGRWDSAVASTRRGLDKEFELPPSIQAAIAGRTVHVDPHAADVATAYPLFNWSPVPIFQAFSAYTAYLDTANADRLRSPERPALILRRYEPIKPGYKGGQEWDPVTYLAIDGRNYWFDSPAAVLERLCRYRETLVDGDWQVLADTGRSCGPETSIETVTAGPGEAVPVPLAPADHFVAVRIGGLDGGLLGRLRTMLLKAPEFFVTLDGIEYRLVPGTAKDGLVLAVPAEAQGSAPFAFGPPVRTISVRSEGLGATGPLTYDFVAIPATAP